jgi:hypothetical protein
VRAAAVRSDDHLAPVAAPGEAPSAALLQAEEQRTALLAAKAQLEATVRERFAAASAKGDHKGAVRFAKLCAPPVVCSLTYLHLRPTTATPHVSVAGGLDVAHLACCVGRRMVPVTVVHTVWRLFTPSVMCTARDPYLAPWST